MVKAQFFKILFLTIFWVSCLIFSLFYEGAITDFKPITQEAIPFTLPTLIPVIFIAFLGASFTASFEVLILSKLFKKAPFGKTLLYKTSFYLFNMVFWFSGVELMSTSLEMGRPFYDPLVMENYSSFLISYRFLVSTIFWAFVTFLGLFILQVSDKFGQGILMNFLLGKYHQPKVENRIFLFMDLKDSTPIAEKIGHIKYSQLLQDCYYDLTEVVLKHDAQIYQYVGDEVVLTWKIKEGLQDNNCLNIFYAYDKVIKEKADYYVQNYKLVPEFKAGLNSGEVTVAEIGEIKKELAYHGDVLNTAARIQGQCNYFKKRLLISEFIKIQLEKQSDYKFEFIGDINLKGKEKPISIYDAKSEEK